jgi:hypothetical protein
VFLCQVGCLGVPLLSPTTPTVGERGWRTVRKDPSALALLSPVSSWEWKYMFLRSSSRELPITFHTTQSL